MKQRYYLFLILLVCFSCFYELKAQTYCTPSYTGAGFNNTGNPTSFYTHILEVSLADIQNTVAAPTTNPVTNYKNFTAISTDLVRGGSYPVTIKLGNGANPQTLAVWIDWNSNQVFESSERLFTQFDNANVGNHEVNKTITVPTNAALGNTRMRVGTKYGTAAPDACSNNNGLDWSQDFHDYSINIIAGTVQTFQKATSSHPVSDEVVPGSSNNIMLQIVVENNSAGTLSPLTATDFNLSLIGTTNPADVTAAKLYYSGNDSRISASTQVGSTITNPSTYFTINANRKLGPGKNYFWLVYDVSGAALVGNLLDARINSITVGGGKRVPDVVSPAGSRKVGYCVTKGNKNNFIYIYNVNFNTINNYTFSPEATGYGNYTNLSTTLYKGRKYNLAVQVGNGVNASYTRAWIDYNRDGDFLDAGELIVFDSLDASQANFTFGPVGDSILIPAGAVAGPTRLRITSSYWPGTYPYTPMGPCTNPVEIGETEDYTVILADSGAAVAEFAASTACFGSPTSFTDNSYTFGNYQINSWVWKFGDGDSSLLQHPTHTYKTAGVYTATLTVKSNKAGAPESTIKKAVIVNAPKANFNAYGSVYQTPILFADESSGGVVTSWQWDFGDPASGTNNTSTKESPTHVFDTVGTYMVKLVVTTAGGCKDSIIKPVKIAQAIPPVANFSAPTYNPYATQPVILLDQSQNKPTSWQWTFSPNTVSFYNNTSATSQNPEVSFNNLGTYKVTLRVQNSAGSDTISRFFVTKNYIKPVADFSASQTKVKAGQLVSFLDQSQNDPISWLWKFGNNDSSKVQHPIYKYKNVGTYTVSLDVANPAGKDSKTRNNYITVSDNYKMCESDAPFSTLFSGKIADSGDSSNYRNSVNCGFLIKPDCAGLITLVFDSFNLAAGDYIRIYDGVDNKGRKLHPGSGFSGSSIPSSVVADSTGSMFIEEVTDGFTTNQGFRARWSAVPNLKPQAGFMVDSVGYENSPLSFTNTTKFGIGNIYTWDFDNDGKTDATTKDASFIFTTAGTYKIKMVAANCKGKDSVFKNIKIVAPTQVPVPDFTASLDTVAMDEPVTFFDKSKFGPSGWEWSFSPNNEYYLNGTDFNSRNPVVAFFEPGYYDVTLTASNSLGTGQPVTKRKFIYVKDKKDLCVFPYTSEFEAGKIYDEGGKDYNYSDFNACDLLVEPCAKEVNIRINFLDLSISDFLRIYDGKNNSGTPLHTGNGFTGSISAPITLTAKSGSFFLEQVNFRDGRSGAGYDIDWSSVPFPKPQPSIAAPDTGYSGGSYTRLEGSAKADVDLWLWDFDGDNVIDDSNQVARYRFIVNGTYKVMLVTTRCSQSDTAYKTIEIVTPNAYPVADFRADMLKASTSDVVSFRDLSQYGPYNWRWRITPNTVTFVNGTDMFSQDPQMMFNDTGLYTIRLDVVNPVGADIEIKQDYIYIFKYCTPAITNTNTDVGISRVILGDIDNTTPVSDTAYTDYTQTHKTRLEQNGNYTISLAREKTFNPMTRKVWIDYNQDGDFDDAGELVVQELNANTLTFTAKFRVPKSAPDGPTRMRVGTGLPGDDNTPCSENSFGEFEDYRIIITPNLTPPVITLKGSNPAYVEVGYPYIDSGATAVDDIDGELSANIVTTTNVDTSKTGTYFVKYNVKDSSGNVAAEVVRTVIVTADKTPPVISLLGPDPLRIQVFTPYIEYGAKATDNRDGDISKNIGIDTSEVDTSLLGTYNAYYVAVDNSGNYSQRLTRVVIVIDTIKPEITLNGSDTIRLELGTPFTDPGATVTDNYYKNLKVTTSGTVNTNAIGTYTLLYSAVDGSGNVAVTKTRVVIVEKTTSISGNSPFLKLDIYPVPAREYFIVSLSLPSPQQVQMTLYNALGQQVMNKNSGNEKNEQFIFNTGGLRSGTYFLKITAGQNEIIKQVQILK